MGPIRDYVSRETFLRCRSEVGRPGRSTKDCFLKKAGPGRLALMGFPLEGMEAEPLALLHLPWTQDFENSGGARAGVYSAHVNGPWCVTFGWDGANAVDVDFEQYH